MKARHLIAAAALAAAALPAFGADAPLAFPSPPAAAIAQQPGAALPLDLPLRDDAGMPVRLGRYFHDGRPVLLVLGYYRCPQLCGLLMHGLLEALQQSGVPRRDWRIVGVSIDPEDTPATARARRDLDLAYADFLLGARAPRAPLDLHLLTASRADSQRLAGEIGFTYQETAAPARYAHPAAVVVATPDGRVSRYLMGIRFDAAELKVALADAAGDRVGGITSRIALVCAHFDPRVGRHSEPVMNVLRAMGIGLAGSLAVWCWRRRAPQRNAR